MGLAFVWEPVVQKIEITRKWRPSLFMVIAICLGVVLVLPIFGLVVLRWVTPVVGWKVGVFWVSLALVTTTAMVGYLQWRLLWRPIRELADASRRLAVGQGAELKPLQHYGTAELRDMGQSVLTMAEKLVHEREAIKNYGDHVIHELKSPITGLRASVELLMDPAVSGDHKNQLLEGLTGSVERMDQLLNALHDHARSGHEVTLGKTVLNTLPILNNDGVRVFGMPSLRLDQVAAEAVLGHLISNAFQAGATRVDVCEIPNGVLVADDGSGVPDQHTSQVFSPFFTTKRDSGGTGMGLPIVKSMIESGGGGVIMWRKGGGMVVELHV